jgi:RHS repeat-associated protein
VLNPLVRDPFGRITEALRPDGTLARRNIYRPLSVETEDPDGRWTRVAVNGHGRTIEVEAPGAISGGGPAGISDISVVETIYQVGGEVARVVQGNTRSATTTARWIEYDSLGRMVLNAEPNTAAGFTSDPAVATGMRAWRYLYNDAGDLVGTSDARGCGENFHYDNLGRLLAEDYSPCLASHAPYTPLINLSVGVGAEAFYRYDAPEPGQTDGFGVPAANLNGRLVSIMDRAAHTQYGYDWRGRREGLRRRLTRPADENGVWSEVFPIPADRYIEQWYATATAYDNSDRVLSVTTGAKTPELTGVGGVSELTTAYSARGLTIQIGGTYGILVEGVTYDADGKLRTVAHGDAAHTRTTFTYDVNGRPKTHEVYRKKIPLWVNGAVGYTPPAAGDLPTTQQLLVKSQFEYDPSGLLSAIHDYRPAVEWPEGAMPVTQSYKYDLRSRLRESTYSRIAADPVVQFTPLDARIPAATLPHRILTQQFGFDAQENLSTFDDDLDARYDRSLGTAVHGALSAGPNQLRSAAGGSISAQYDEAGNMTHLIVQRSGPCEDPDGRCTHRFAFDWDEVGRLSRARRWDYEAIPADEPVYPELPTTSTAADLRYRYDAGGLRVITSSLKSDGTQRHTAELFETFQLMGAMFDDDTDAYEQSAATERVRVPGVGEVLYRPGLPRLGDSDRHVFINFPDHLGSTLAVIDYATGELVQRTSYQAFGQADSDYLPPRWGGVAARERFSGKPEDREVGLTYFGARYYHTALGRWISADPLTVHGVSTDHNPYSYVGGQPSMAVDPVGLEPRCTENCLVARQQGFNVSPNAQVTTPIVITGTADPSPSVEAAPTPITAPVPVRRGPPVWTGAMKLLVNMNPIVFGFAMYADPGRTLNTIVIPRMEAIESLLGAPNTGSDLADPTARAAGSQGQLAMTDTDQLLSITEQELEGAVIGAAFGRVLRGAAAMEIRGATAESCPGGTCLSGFECFTAGTLVSTTTGNRPIETIRPGDRVLSRDQQTGEISMQPVTRTFVTRERSVVEVILRVDSFEDRLQATPTHPFFVLGSGWVGAGQLQPGMFVATANGTAAVLEVSPTEGTHTVYNLEVASTHTYFVGQAATWVHNTCPKVFADKVAPGPYANGFIELPGPERNFSPAQHEAMNVIGARDGCHTCPSKEPLTKSGNWVIDHQPPVAFNKSGGPYRGYPQCALCGLIKRGGTSQPFQIRQIQRRRER